MTTEQAIDALRRTFVDAFNRGDAATIASLHTNQSILMPAGLPSVIGQDSILELIQSTLAAAPPDMKFEFESSELRIADGWAVERGITKASGSIPAGKYVMLYQKEEDGHWRIAWSITNSDAPPPPPE
ncbi:DUF4440 domain-containing protein [Wenzhouxiangella sp. XN201]|uniref:YybH family protein n=1 Tax=Wenzhouxiangella sp. XN201 TaxID=2710755 RepID=UPI0013CD5C86|nr:DUF4440 domain-containing protein [Wenzhouxiangella sp. XN201]NEZ02548.1 DUF4440 domain-containing protein [Wenzhouxiangella sp. XN201]